MAADKIEFDKKYDEIPEDTVMSGFVFSANMGLSSKDEIIDKLQVIEDKLNSFRSELDNLAHLRADDKTVNDPEIEADIEKRQVRLGKEYKEWEYYFSELNKLISTYKNFNKSKCFSNIRELLRQTPNVKIGQIEKEAGVRLGYMARLEKEDNTAEPSMEFIVTAAKLLNVSIDTLININIKELTSTEQYLIKFFDKLKADTLLDKLDWKKEDAYTLNYMGQNSSGNVDHPLFEYKTFFEKSDCEYPEEVERVVFTSKSFNTNTFIAGDCFNLRLKNGTTLYLMDIEKTVSSLKDRNRKAKEAWIYVPSKGAQVLVTTLDTSPVAPALELLFSTVKERMEHPKVDNAAMYAIDAFMKDDLNDDENDKNAHSLKIGSENEQYDEKCNS